MAQHDRREMMIEMLAALATGIGFVVASAFVASKLYIIVPIILVWLGYILMRAARDRSVLSAWGLRFDNLRAASRVPLLFTGVCFVLLAAYRAWVGLLPLPVTALWLFFLYPLWALFQQLFVQSFIARNLAQLGLPRAAVIAIAAALFGAVHFPDWTLVLFCTIAGAIWTACFLAVPNIVPLALAHGWIGTLAYYWLLERAPLSR